MTDSTNLATFRSSRKKWIVILVSSLPFIAIGFWLISSFDEVTPLILGYASILLFGGTAAVSILCLIYPGISSLTITREGLYVRTFWQTRFYRWIEIETFGIENITTEYRGLQAGQAFVGFNLSSAYEETGHDSRFTRFKIKSGGDQIQKTYDRTLPDTYGADPEELAGKLNDWRELYR